MTRLMESEIVVSWLGPPHGIDPPVVSLTFECATFTFRVPGADTLLQWRAYLLAHRDDPITDDPPQIEIQEGIEVGRLRSNWVRFALSGQAMRLLISHDTGMMETNEALLMWFPREHLDDLADGLARAHREWIESLPPPEATTSAA
jgi:hypothetical protein